MRRGILILLLLSGLVGLFSCRQSFLSGMGHWLNAAEKPRQADYVMVLPGGPNTRPFVAAAMVRHGMAKKVLTSKVAIPPEVADGIYPADHEQFRETLRRRGLCDAQIQVLPGASDSTFTDGLALREFLEKNPHATIAIVTSDFHVRRSRWVMRRVLGELESQVFYVAAPTDEFSADDWWQYEDGVRAYLGEYSKLAVYLAIYGGPIVWGCPVVLLVIVMGTIAARRRGAPRKASRVVESRR